MKKLIVIAMLLIGGGAMAQTTFGIKGGINYGATGDITYGVDDITTNAGRNKAGYHLGTFARFKALGFFVQPELVYTNLSTEYLEFIYTLRKIDAPILLGVNILGPLNIKAGPSFQYVLQNKIEDSSIKITMVDKNITVGYQLGAGLNLGRVGLDVRYEGAFVENNAFSQMARENFRIDSRPSQWIFSLAYSFN